jgi:hypothetical protein
MTVEFRVRLRSLLFNFLLVAHNAGTRVILTRFCVALAAYALQASGTAWSNIVDSVVAFFTQQNVSQ